MQQQPIKIDLEKTDEFECYSCSGKIFEQIYFIRTISPLLSPTGNKEMIPIPVFACVRCRAVADITKPVQRKGLIQKFFSDK